VVVAGVGAAFAGGLVFAWTGCLAGAADLAGAFAAGALAAGALAAGTGFFAGLATGLGAGFFAAAFFTGFADFFGAGFAAFFACFLVANCCPSVLETSNKWGV
jgi:hypothetical protein